MDTSINILKDRTIYLAVLFSFFLILMILISLSMGYIHIPMMDIISILYGKTISNLQILDNTSETYLAVIFDIRLPRILTCAIVGAALAVSGSLFQGILLNPLADPYTLGVSAGAAFGASIAILLNLSAAFVSVPAFAFTGACTTLFLVLFLSYSSKNPMSGLSSNNLILSGIIVAAILSAGISFLKFIANEQVSVIIFWLMGSFASKTWLDFWVVLIFLMIGLFISIFFARDLNLISLGAKSATSLGVDLKKITIILLVTGSMLAAVCVSVSGIIGFVGLLVPHTIRFITGPDNRKLIPLSMIAGAFLLLFADTITRAVLPHEIPIGVLTALTGGPVFCWIFKKNRFK
ncbi:FecCD family ABC transporter permease [Desulfobacula sp.]|uniref:FecCD family ABC transporter permease n=1 Tax=Desulfobacula sp. TaxID=2593537 RepID=UPI0039B8A35C